MMRIPDFINGLYEGIGSLMVWLNVRTIYRDKQVKGIYLGSMLFFTSWSLWNLYYYPSLHQWLSFSGGISLALANVAWTILAFKYKKN